jgi:hypothetical protein
MTAAPGHTSRGAAPYNAVPSNGDSNIPPMDADAYRLW